MVEEIKEQQDGQIDQGQILAPYPEVVDKEELKKTYGELRSKFSDGGLELEYGEVSEGDNSGFCHVVNTAEGVRRSFVGSEVCKNHFYNEGCENITNCEQALSQMVTESGIDNVNKIGTCLPIMSNLSSDDEENPETTS